jgi:hypothetical protein
LREENKPPQGIEGPDMAEDRLHRIEGKLDKLAEAVVSLARMEERMVTLFKRMDKYDAAQDSLDERLSEIEKTSIQRGVVGGWVEKTVWLVIGAGVAVIAKNVWAG